MHNDLHTHLTAITAAEQHTYLEVRYSTATGMRQRFFPARRLANAAWFIKHFGQHTDVYVGVAPRTRRACGRSAITHSHLVWAELDQPDAAQRLATLGISASLAIHSGTPGHLHTYWRLSQPLPPGEVEQLNQRLALALDADQRCCDIARILRPPQTRSFKHTPPVPVTLAHATTARYSSRDLDSALPQLPAPPAPALRRPRGPRDGEQLALEQQLRAIAPRDYIAALTGRTPDRTGKIACPFPLHDDHTPSLQVYQDHWYCYGACAAGGTIIDFASRLWSIPPRGHGYIELCERLAQLLLPLSPVSHSERSWTGSFRRDM